MATWRMLFHAVFHTTLHYVTAPKAFNVSASTRTSFNSLPSDEFEAPLLKSTESISIVMGGPEMRKLSDQNGYTFDVTDYSSNASTADSSDGSSM